MMSDRLMKGTSSDSELAHTIFIGRSVGSSLLDFINVPPEPVGSVPSEWSGGKPGTRMQFRKQRRVREQIAFLGTLKENWDHRSAPPPSPLAIRLALQIVSHGTPYDILPDAVGPSPDGGIMLEFRAGGKYFLIDIYNDGDIVLLRENEHGEMRTTQESEKDLDRMVLELWGAFNEPAR